jgi:hypothetical protein
VIGLLRGEEDEEEGEDDDTRRKEEALLYVEKEEEEEEEGSEWKVGRCIEAAAMAMEEAGRRQRADKISASSSVAGQVLSVVVKTHGQSYLS